MILNVEPTSAYICNSRILESLEQQYTQGSKHLKMLTPRPFASFIVCCPKHKKLKKKLLKDINLIHFLPPQELL